MKKTKPKTITLLVEYIKNGIYVREYQTFTLKKYKKMLKNEQKGVNYAKNC